MDRHPRIGTALLALREPPRHERAWARGAVGEERVSEVLARRLGGEVVLLHDRRVPGSRANIDHIVIAPSGVWVIDTKRYAGKVAVRRPLFGAAKLTISGRDRTKLVLGLRRQMAVIERELAELGLASPVHGALCFVDAELPLMRALTFDGCLLLHPKGLAKRIRTSPIGLTPDEAANIASGIAKRLPPA